ncbi:aminotransferase class I/II-fold pyridoxal phosphate-dependent enzyme, partial [Brevundimonas sp.]|uniref:aminotransferase class I/II-fold pyridoxal phosphate-dependent enzyme n=1 Tax=Brevundimonas sp. TaxID=1871086 RepID=UPI002EDB2F9E
MSLDSFARQQEQMRGQFSKAFGAAPGAGLIDEAVKRNMAMFAEAMKMWPGFSAAGAARPAAAAAPQPEQPAADPLAEMRRQMDEMRAQLDKLAQPPGKAG